MISDNIGYEEIGGEIMNADGGAHFVGADELGIMGDDELGAAYAVQAKNQRNAALRDRDAVNAMIQRRVQSGSIVRDVSPTKSREYIIGFGITTVAANGTSTPSQRPQVLFRPERIIIPSNIALDFMLLDIKIGKNSQFTASASVPAIVFAETSFGVRLKMDTCQISMDIILSIQNLSGNAKNFSAAIIGPAVE